MGQELKYRPEIDGLRALAVLAVIVFHLNPQLLKGGFLGVDVFFVISGYLITSIIYRQIQEQRFSLWTFWKRRFRRLYPALVCVVTVTMAAGLLLLPHPERGALPKQAIGALFSFSNVYLWHTTQGYWSTASENISLLHTWSLSLEEQFYIFFPLILLLGYTFLKRHIGKLVIALFIASLALCLTLTENHRSAAFYLLHTRMWELLIGGLLAIYGSPFAQAFQSAKAATSVHLIGLALIITSYFIIENGHGFPGYHPAFTCIGTYLLLALPSERSLVTRVLSTSPFVYLGKISYSLYLWHWPIIVYAYYITPYPNHLFILALTLTMAMISYHFVEQPFRSASKLPRMPTIASVSTVGLCFIALFLTPQSPFLDELGEFDSASAFSRGWEYEATADLLDAKHGPGTQRAPTLIVVVGSSHARMICKPLDAYAQENGHGFLSLASSGIGITEDDKSQHNAAVNAKKFNMINQLAPDLLVMAGKWDSELLDRQGEALFRERLKTAATDCGQVLVIGQIPLVDLPYEYDGALRKFMVANHLSSKPAGLTPAKRTREANNIVRRLIRELDSDVVTFIDPTDFLTTETGHVRAYEGTRFLYSDHHHINDIGAKLLFDSLIHPRIALDR